MTNRFTMAITDQARRTLARAWSTASIALLALLLSAGAHAHTTVEYIHTDALGSPVAVTDASGNVIEREVYEPYGSPITRPPSDQPGFTGHVTDSLTNLTYMQQRYYDPQVGRFLSADPVTAYSNPVVAFNRYWYANNNPYRFTDPDGRKACGNNTTCALEQGAQERNNGRPPQTNGPGRYGRPPQPSDPSWTRDSGLRKQTEQAWTESNPDAPSVPKGANGSLKKEQSGWVVQTSGSTRPELVRLSPGSRDQASREALNKPSPSTCNCRVLGFFHTHPNTRAEGYIPNANGYDYQFQLDMGVPGLIRSHEGYEYIRIPEAR